MANNAGQSGQIGTAEQPLRVAVIGAGPAGFYIIASLLKQQDVNIEVDLFDRLPTPFGLVRAGVAPDHQKDKSVTRVYDKSATRDNVRFFGGVEYGTHMGRQDLQNYYHQIVFTNGASRDRNLGIPGENLNGSHSATDFVAWYNGHPDYADLQFDLSQPAVAIVGIGNVALDVARILCKSPDELIKTDIADHAVAALRESRVRDIYLLGRRGPAQAAFTPPEIREFGEIDDIDIQVDPREAELDPLSRDWLAANPDRNVEKNLETINRYAAEQSRQDAGKRLHLRFWVSPTEIIDNGSGGIGQLKIVRNQPLAGRDGGVRAQAGDHGETLDVGLVFRSVGYRGAPLPDIPFNDAWGTIQNQDGRITDDVGNALPGLYTAGWIKRGPTGVIGTNKTCAQDTVNGMLEDMRAGRLLTPANPQPAAAAEFIREQAPHSIDYSQWQTIDAAEQERGAGQGRPRVKFTRIADMLALVE